MDIGSIQQVGTPEEIYEQPVNVFVARFIGVPRMNLINCELRREDGRLFFAHPAFTLPVPPEQVAAVEKGVTDESIVLGIRPEDVSVSEQSTPGSVPAEVYVLEPQSNEILIDLSIGDMIVKSRSDQDEIGFAPRCNQSLHVTFDSDSIHVFDGQSERRIA
jgi:multiple sugar transport system ATP-binding protein